MKALRLFFTVLIFLCGLQKSVGSIAVLNGLTHRVESAEGTIHRGSIQLQNTGDQSQAIKAYINDYSYQANGQIEYSRSGSNNRTNASWVTLSENHLRIKPKQIIELHYEIKIPKELPHNGSYWSVVMIEPVEDIEAKHEKQSIQLTTLIRYAVQLVTTVKKSNALSLVEYINAQLKQHNNYYVLEVDLENKGELYHKIQVKAEFYDAESGKKQGNYNSETLSLLPGTSKRFSIAIDQLRKGDYKVVLLADTQEEVFGLNMDLSVNEE